MKVSELIEVLRDFDPDARVLIMSQPGWPFEHSVAGVAVREDFAGDDEDDGETEGSKHENGIAANDVFILEGEHLRYGSQAAWDVV